MHKHVFKFLLVCIALAACSSPAFPQQSGGTAKKVPVTPASAPPAAPAPYHDLSGVWDAGGKGILPTTGVSHPAFTPWGQEQWDAHKPGWGPREVPAAESNDPLATCDPIGFPRNELYDLRPIEIIQQPNRVLILYMNFRLWRVIWTDGRALPRSPDPKFYGYSVGRWEGDDLIADTIGLDERSWLDDEGYPHSADALVEERWHRVDNDNLELKVTINDPKTYTKPWQAVDIPMKLSPKLDMEYEIFCLPSEVKQYRESLADPIDKKK